MNSENETKRNKKTEEYRTNITLNLIRISGDVEHMKESLISVVEHLEKINGRVRVAENNITGIKATGFTLYTVIGLILTWLGLKN